MNWPKAIILAFLFGTAVYACGSSEPKAEPTATAAVAPAPAQAEETPVDNLTPTQPGAVEPTPAETPSPPPAAKPKPEPRPAPSRTRATPRTEPAPTREPEPEAGEVSQPPQSEPVPPASQDPVIVPSPPRRPQGDPDVANRAPDRTEDQTTPPPPDRRDQGTSRRAGEKVVLREGTAIEVRMTRTLSSDLNQTGDRFEAILDRDLEADGQVVARRGDRVTGHLEGVDPGGRVQGRAEMTLRLESIETRENSIPIQTNRITIEAESGTKDDAKTVGVAAGIGAAIGAIAGGKKGAAIGAAIGGGAGTAKVLTSRGKDATVEREQLLSFRLEKDVEVGS